MVSLSASSGSENAPSAFVVRPRAMRAATLRLLFTTRLIPGHTIPRHRDPPLSRQNRRLLLLQPPNIPAASFLHRKAIPSARFPTTSPHVDGPSLSPASSHAPALHYRARGFLPVTRSGYLLICSPLVSFLLCGPRVFSGTGARSHSPLYAPGTR